jgi:hypothetical protein
MLKYTKLYNISTIDCQVVGTKSILEHTTEKTKNIKKLASIANRVEFVTETSIKPKANGINL